MVFFEKYKKFCITLISVIAVFYALFLLVIPNVVNLNIFKKDIQKIVLDMTDLRFDFQSMKIVTTPSLKAGLRVKGLDLAYKNGTKIFELGNAEVKLSLLPLLIKTVQVSDVVVNSPKVSLVYTKDGQIDLVKHFCTLFEQQQTTTQTATAELPVKISNKLPKVFVTDYDLVLSDEKTNNKISLNGDNFVLKNAEINKQLDIFADGKILVNADENIKYNVKIFSFWPIVATSAPTEQTSVALPYIDFINEIVKFSPKANVVADVRIFEKKSKLAVDGYFNVDGISVILDKRRLPESFVHILSKGYKTTIKSDFALNDKEKASVNASVDTAKKLKLDLNFKTEKITFEGLQKYFAALLNSFHIKNDIDAFKTSGYITADFGLKTDMKKLESYGYFKALDGSISHKLVPVKIHNISADLDFDNNSLNINKAGLNVNDAKITLKGYIDSSANTDIVLDSGVINISPLFNAFAPVEIKKMYNLQSGVLEANILAKGNLAKIEPDVNLSVKNILLKDKLNSFVLSNELAKIYIKAKSASFDGDVSVANMNFKVINPALKISLPTAKIKVNPTDLAIIPFDIFMNSSKINVSGGVKNYTKKTDINILANGNVNSLDLKNILPKEVRTFVSSKGVVPLKAQVKGDDKKLDFKAQVYSDANNHFSPLIIKKMIGKSGLINLDMSYINGALLLSDASIYQSVRNDFGDDFSYNKKGSTKIAGLNGSVNDLLSIRPSMKLTFSIPEPLVVSNAGFPNASLNVRGDLSILGLLSRPEFKGFFSVKNIDIPEILTKVQDVDLELNGNLLSAKVQNLNLGGTSMNVDAQASTVFSNVFLVKNMKLYSENFDVDNLFKAMDKMMALMPPAQPALSASKTPTVVLPVKIANGTIDIQKLKMKQIGGDFVATNIGGDFTLSNDLFKLNNLKTTVYNGTVTGDVTYNIATTAVSADVKGKSVDANQAVTVFVALKDQLLSNVDFNANVKLKGVTYEEQMKTLNGVVDFSMKDGQMGSLGRFETFLKADNLLSQNFVSTQVGSLINTVAPYNTGKFSYLNGDLKLVNGVAKLNSIKMSGPHMSLLITGDVNVLSMDSDMTILGSLSPEVNSSLGVVSDLSVEKFAAYIPKFGAKIASAMNAYNAPLKEAELAKIPALSPTKENTKSFKVLLDGNLNNPPAAIEKFQWLNTPEKLKAEQASLENSVSQTLKTQPITKEEVKKQVAQTVKNKIESNEKVQEIKENKTVKTLTGIYNFYKKSQPSTSGTLENVEQ